MVMNTRALGDSGLSVTPMGLGLAALGRPGYINLGHAQDLDEDYQVAAMESHTHQVLDAAWEAGIRYFDAARSYGRAEQFLGSWLNLRQVKPESVTVGSKWGYTYTAGWQVEAEQHEVKEHSLAVLQRQIKESRGLLGDQLDLYQIHSATLESGVLDNQPVLDELARLKAGGLRIGLTLSGPDQAKTVAKALSIKRDGRRLFDTVQATWNLLERSAGPALADAAAAGMGVIVKEALANGRLTPRNQDPDFFTQRRLLEDMAADHRTTIDALALAFVLAQPWAHLVLSGAATTGQLQDNTGALSVDWTEEMTAQVEPLRETPQAYWTTRSQLAWN